MTERRDGNWLDEWGACKVCDGEIPHGHADHCDIYKLEVNVRTLESRIADNERWMREVLTDWKVPFDNHLQGLRLAFTQFMFDQNQKIYGQPTT